MNQRHRQRYPFLASWWNEQKAAIEQNRLDASANEKKIALGELAARLAHDIRSPLNTLESVSSSIISNQTEQERLFKKAIQRIREIANEVMQTYRIQASGSSDKAEKSEPYLLVSLVDDLIEEKRHQYKENPLTIKLSYDQTSGMAISNLTAGDFKRHISNLIDNAAEATDFKGIIDVSVTSDDQFSVVKVKDNGKGLSKDKLARIGEKGFTSGKANGSGLGLYYLKKSVQDQNGVFEFESQENAGTTVTVKLIKSSQGLLGQKNISLADFDKILLLDDDSSVHESWRQRFQALGGDYSIEHAFDPTSAQDWLKRQPRSDRILLLSDFELHHKINGLEFIEKSKNQVAASVLITTNCSDAFVREESRRMGVSLVPKSLISTLEIS
jgi:anti-sigma regulatory factor (Ser/Thr protein kinase)